MYDEIEGRVAELWCARNELEVRLGDMNKELEALEQTMRHLAPLAGRVPEEPDSVANLGITNAVRGVLDPKIRMSTAEIRTKMEQRGFDFSKYSAPDASIRTILKRLVEAKKAAYEKEGYKIFYRYLTTIDDL